MVRIKKITLVLIIVGSLILGAVGVCAAMGFTVKDFAGEDNAPVLVSGELYKDYERYQKTYGKLDMLRSEIKNSYYVPVDDEKIEDAMLHGLFDCLDQYSMYFNAEEYAQDQIDTLGEYSGVGLTISYDDTGYIVVVAPTEDTPADKAGIKTGDYILAVDGVEYFGEDLSKAAAAMRGPEGTEVTVTVRHEDTTSDIILKRASISVESVKYEMLDNDVAYIRITQFMSETGNKFEAALHDLESQGAKALVIDIRTNGGGLVNICNDIADLIMDQGTLIYTEDCKGNREYYKTNAGRTELPYVILVNGGSASASEILCAGVQDNEEGIIVGTQTFGKGIIQSGFGLADGSGVQLTVMQYFSPKGNAIHGVGITPDYVVELTDDCYDESGQLINDVQLNKAIELLTKQ